MKKMGKAQMISDMDLVLDMNRVLEKIPNKYEFIIVISKFAHIIARRATEEGIYLRRKPYLIAAEAVLSGEVPYGTKGSQPVTEEQARPTRRKRKS
ncbi:MAG: DNA-directed RNA polymerase subunit omega [Candidatus Hydrothermia bacterium]